MEKRTNEFKIEVGQTFKDDNRDLIIIDRKHEKKQFKDGHIQDCKYYKYRCNKCGFYGGEHYKNDEYIEEHWIIERDLIKGIGCSCCSGKIVVEGINDINTTNPEMVKFFVDPEDSKKHTRCSTKKVKVICPDCNRVKDKEMPISKIYNRKSIGCSCGDGITYPEKFMFNMLEQLNVKFEYQFSPCWIGLMRYDFYFELKDKKYIVEMDGGLGHGKAVHGKSNKTIEETKADDYYKDEQARLHNIEVVRIDSDKSELKFIKNSIINSKLIELFDLSVVNWIKCGEFALSNRAKESCKIKKNNPNMTTLEMADIMKLDRATITRYLKKGNELGWCDYDPKEEKFKGSSKSGKMNSVSIKMFKDNILVGIFESASELERQSEELFGFKLSQSKISQVCNNKRNHHKGFTFEIRRQITNNK